MDNYEINILRRGGNWKKVKPDDLIIDEMNNDLNETKNIHLCTIKDFEELCLNNELKIIEKHFLNEDGESIKNTFLANLFAAEGVYLVGSR